MSRIYTVNFENVSVSAAQDFFEFDAAAEKPIRLLGLVLGQAGNSDVGDAAEELLRITIQRGHTTSGSGGTAPTPRPLNPSDAAAGFTSEVNNTTIASVGTSVVLWADSFNVRAGYQLWFPPRLSPETSGALLLVVRLAAAPADAITLSGTATIEEVG